VHARFFHDLRNAANSRFGPREGEVVPVGSQIVNGFLFLRLFCPAIVAPQLYGLADSDPDQRAGRILKVIARVLQYLANFKTEIEGEVFTPENVKAINAFLAENQDAMRAFVDTICSRERATLRVYGRAALPVDLERYGRAAACTFFSSPPPWSLSLTRDRMVYGHDPCRQRARPLVLLRRPLLGAAVAPACVRRRAWAAAEAWPRAEHSHRQRRRTGSGPAGRRSKDNRMSLGSVTEDISNAYKKQWPQNSQPYHYAPPTQA